MNIKTNLNNCLDLYLDKYSFQAISTRSNKERVIRSFISFVPESDSIKEEYIANWEKSRKVSTNTLNGNLSIIRQFLIFCTSFGIMIELPTIKKYHDDYIPYIFSDEETDKIISIADNITSCSRVSATKEFCVPMIIRLLAYSGLRLNETLALKCEDYNNDSNILIIKNSKRKKERIVPLHSTLACILNQYISQLKSRYPECVYLFPNNSLIEHITKNQFEYEFRKIINIADFDYKTDYFQRGICPHCFRHTFAVNSLHKLTVELENDVVDSLPVLSTYLGHERLNETEKYLKFSCDSFPETADIFETFSESIW